MKRLKIYAENAMTAIKACVWVVKRCFRGKPVTWHILGQNDATEIHCPMCGYFVKNATVFRTPMDQAE